MIYYIGSKLAVLTFWLAICGIILGLIFGVLVFVGDINFGGILIIPISIILPACILSFALLILSFFNRELFSKYFKKICITFILTFIPSALVISFFVYAGYVIFHEEPYDESLTLTIISKIEKNFAYKFPGKIESLKAADTIAAGIDRPYVFIVRFITDHNGLSEIEQSGGEWGDITKEIAVKDSPEIRFYSVRAPSWYKKQIEKGKTYQNYFESKNRKLCMEIICVEESPSESVIVYMKGFGNVDYKEFSGKDIRGIMWRE